MFTIAYCMWLSFFFLHQTRALRIWCDLLATETAFENMMRSTSIRHGLWKYAAIYAHQKRPWKHDANYAHQKRPLKIWCDLRASDTASDNMMRSTRIRNGLWKHDAIYTHQKRPLKCDAIYAHPKRPWKYDAIYAHQKRPWKHDAIDARQKRPLKIWCDLRASERGFLKIWCDLRATGTPFDNVMRSTHITNGLWKYDAIYAHQKPLLEIWF